jgi:hypothetical protein
LRNFLDGACRSRNVEQVARIIDHRVKELFPDGAVARAELLRDGDAPGQLTVRVFVSATEDLAEWAATHRERMEELRRELSLRLPSARQVAAAVEARLAAGEYDNLDEITLTDLLTSHLQEASGDKHLAVRLGGGPGPERGPGGGPGRPAGGPGEDQRGGYPQRDESADHEVRRLKMRQMGRMDNFGIRRVERLDGNIGYLDLRRIPMPENAGPAIAAAMELVSTARCTCWSAAARSPAAKTSATRSRPWAARN